MLVPFKLVTLAVSELRAPQSAAKLHGRNHPPRSGRRESSQVCLLELLQADLPSDGGQRQAYNRGWETPSHP